MRESEFVPDQALKEKFKMTDKYRMVEIGWFYRSHVNTPPPVGKEPRVSHSEWNDGWNFAKSGPGCSVVIANDYGLEGPGSNPGGDEIFRPSRPALEPTQPPVKSVPGLSRG